jgi:hypothetical protein
MTYVRVGYLWKTTFGMQRPVYYNKDSNSLYYMRENNREAVVHNPYPSLLPISVQNGQRVVAEKKVFNFTADPLLWKLKGSS